VDDFKVSLSARRRMPPATWTPTLRFTYSEWPRPVRALLVTDRMSVVLGFGFASVVVPLL
jgi:hypothetical protein